MQLSKLKSDQLLEWYTAEALRRHGYDDVQPSSLEEIGKVRIESDDRARQIDVYAIRTNALGLTEHLLVECKRHNEPVDSRAAEIFSTAVDAIRGKLSGPVQGLFVSTSELGESARSHLRGKGIQIKEGAELRAFLGSSQYDAIIHASTRENSPETLEEYFGKIHFPIDEIIKTIRIDGVTSLKAQNSEITYVPLVLWEFNIPLKSQLPGTSMTCALTREVKFMVRFFDNQPVICDEFEHIRADDLVDLPKNLVKERTLPSTLLDQPDMLDPFVERLVWKEALQRGQTTIHYAPIIDEWIEGDPCSLRQRAIVEIEEREQTETNERRRDYDKRIFDLESDITKAEAVIDSTTEKLQSIDGLEESPRQTRHRAELQGKLTEANHLLEGFRRQRYEILKRIDREIEPITRKYQKQKAECVREIVIQPDRNQLAPTKELVWIPKLKGAVLLNEGTQVPLEWNGVSGQIRLGVCPHCKNTITYDNGALCYICLRIVCREDSITCNKCLKIACTSDLWGCPTCGRRWCIKERKSSCILCKVELCQECRIICTDCGEIVCTQHSRRCSRCERMLCQRDAISCTICSSLVCHSEVTHCEGCGRLICRTHTAACPNCLSVVCQDCKRKHLPHSIRRVLKAHGRESRCILCINRSP